jgi:NADH-quinone oxidoreductase subunit N
MNASTMAALSPLLILAITVVMQLVSIAIARDERAIARLSLIGILAASAAAWRRGGSVGPLLSMDAYARFFMALFSIAGAAIVVFLRVSPLRRKEEAYVLLLAALLGAFTLAASTHVVTFVLGLETLSISLYALIGYERKERSLEAAFKYLVLSGASSAFLLFGLALGYARAGSGGFAQIATQLAGTKEGDLLVVSGALMVLVGIGFKLGLVPFHMWVADVYQGAPPAITAFIAAISKSAVFALLARVLLETGLIASRPVALALSVVALVSMLAGSLLALLQDDVRRLLAYSSIAQLGFVLTGLLAGGAAGVQAVEFFLAAYVLTMVAAFGVITVLPGADRDRAPIAVFRGLFWTRPALALAMTAALLSLAGIPITAGFVAKLYVLAASMGSRLWVLVAALIVSSAISIFFYLRVIYAMVLPAAPVARPAPWGASSPAVIVMLVLLAGVVWLGVDPDPLARWMALPSAVSMRSVHSIAPPPVSRTSARSD